VKRAGRLKGSIVAASMAAFVVGAGGVVLASSAIATTTMTATTWVNLRSGPATSYAVVTVLAPEEPVEASGTVTNGWYEVTTTSGEEGWVYQNYLAAAAASSTPQATEQLAAPVASGSATTTTSVNVRSGPGTSYSVVATLAQGTTVPTTGRTDGSWTEVIHAGSARWMYSSYLSAAPATPAAPDTPGTPAAPETPDSPSGTPTPDLTVTGQVATTAALYLRTGGSLSAASTGVLPRNSIVDTTGRTTADYTEIVHGGALRWIATRYTTVVTATTPAAPSAPAATGTVYVNVGTLNVRATSAPASAVVGVVYRGASLPATGVTSGDRTQVIHGGVARWVYTPYVSATPPAPSSATPLSSTVTTSGISQLNANAKAVVQHVLDAYPKIRTIYGWRASSDYSSDHPNGRAVDIMLANWSDPVMTEYGWQIARDFAANAGTYKVTYIIYRQSVWNASYPERGWRPMEDRGSITANHYDHVHVSVSA